MLSLVCLCMCVRVFFSLLFSASIRFNEFFLSSHLCSCIVEAKWCCLHHFLCVLALFFLLHSYHLLCSAVRWCCPCDTFLELLLVQYRHLCVAFSKWMVFNIVTVVFFACLFRDVLVLLFGHQKNGRIWLNKSQNWYWQRGGFIYLSYVYNK